jgi:hypothetical protein
LGPRPFNVIPTMGEVITEKFVRFEGRKMDRFCDAVSEYRSDVALALARIEGSIILATLSHARQC